MAAPQSEPRRHLVPFALALGLAAALIPLVPEQYRPWNFAAFGALGLFVAARGGRYSLPWAALLALGSKLGSDLLNYVQKGYNPEYLPFSEPVFGLAVYACFVVPYPLLGRAGLRRADNPLRIAGVTVSGGVVFFLVTNFASWLHQDLPYPLTPDGLLQSYVNGLPFIQGTLIGDLLFSGLLFGLYAVAVRLTAGRPAAVDAVRS